MSRYVVVWLCFTIVICCGRYLQVVRVVPGPDFGMEQFKAIA